jgi:hypothetical protein
MRDEFAKGLAAYRAREWDAPSIERIASSPKRKSPTYGFMSSRPGSSRQCYACLAAVKPNATRCCAHSIENGASRSASCSVAGGVPFRMASTMSGANRDSLIVRER